jgi:GNAT superfamily N-acetyltransferase
VARNPVHVRDALPDDAEVLVGMWENNIEASSRLAPASVKSARRAIGNLALDPDQRIVLGVVDDQVVGVAYLQRAPLSPIHEETTVRVGHLFVHSEFRGRGVGRALLGYAAAWADEKETKHLLVNVSAAAREANRFLARLGLTSIATVRATSVAALQERLAKASEPACADGHVVVERLRTLRRRQASARRRQSADPDRHLTVT